MTRLGLIASILISAIRAWREYHHGPGPLVVGVCGSQGSGKSTACAAVARDFLASGIQAAVLSLDDLYLSAAARSELANRVHPLLATRGVPGTHDVALGLKMLQELRAGRAVRLPRFDKAIDDRLAESNWPLIDTAVDVVLFEGWCVGARPQSSAMLTTPANELEAREDADGRWRLFVNETLSRDYQALFAPIDFLVLLAAPSFEVVVRWRTEQERELRARKGGGPGVMPDAAIERFVQHYERLTRQILAEMPSRADLLLRLDESRGVIG